MIAIVSPRRPFEVTGRFVLACLLGFFFTVASVNAVMIRFALTTFGGVETESSYKAGLAFKAETVASAAQLALGWKVDARIDPRIEGAQVNVTVRDAAGAPVPNLVLDVTLAHPADRRRDIVVSTSELSAGMFRGVASPNMGRRTVTIELSRDGERMFRSVNRVTLP
jgi:nitrogen fixation protein FixH